MVFDGPMVPPPSPKKNMRVGTLMEDEVFSGALLFESVHPFGEDIFEHCEWSTFGGETHF